MQKVKLCGITRLEDALYAQELGFCAIGFVFYKNSKRYIDPIDALNIAVKVTGIKKIGVFVNENSDDINKIADMISLDYVQLHGYEDINVCNSLTKPYIKNIRSIEEIEKYANASYYLTDAKDDISWGGTGKLCDWDLALKIKNNNKKLILSGGISIDNIEKALQDINPDVIDVSSSLEDAPGIKNHELMKAFFDKIRHGRSNNE